VQKVTHFTVSKIGLVKLLWGDLEASPPQLLGVGAIAPMESAPMK